MKTKKALITGITGQDGSYLAELLLKKNYQVYGLVRRNSVDSFARVDDLYLSKKVKFLYGNLRDLNTVKNAINESKPDEIYNLAAQSDVGVSFKCPEETEEINYYGVGRLVNEAMKVNPNVKIYQASTSEMFGRTKPPQSEKSAFAPVSPYALAKLKAHEDFVVGYRKKHGLFVCSGILFNHESPRRGQNFVTRKITIALAKIKLGRQKCLELGNLDAKRDWGFAGDYVEAMWRMLQRDKPRDYVVATGKSHSVRKFVEIAAEHLGIKVKWSGGGVKEIGKDQNGKTIIRVNKEFYRPNEVNYLCGDSRLARKELGWKPETSFKELVKMMVESDFKILSA